MDLLTLYDGFNAFPGLYDTGKVFAASKLDNPIGRELKSFLSALKKGGFKIETTTREGGHIYEQEKVVRTMALIMHERAEFIGMRESHRDNIDWEQAAWRLLQSYESPFACAKFYGDAFYAWRGDNEEKQDD